MVDLWNHADQMASGQVTMLLELQNSWPIYVYPIKYGHGQVTRGSMWGWIFHCERGVATHVGGWQHCH
jgi:hypothetical protein